MKLIKKIIKIVIIALISVFALVVIAWGGLNIAKFGIYSDYYNGKVITLTESSSNKYIFGKFFFANKIIALEI